MKNISIKKLILTFIILNFTRSIALAQGNIESRLSFQSAAGDFIGQGKTINSTSYNFSGTGSDSNVRISMTSASENWQLTLAAPAGEKLHPGIYNNSERAPFRTGRSSGLEFSGMGRGCNDIWGNFTIRQIAYDAGGTIKVLDADFTQRCGSATAPVLQLNSMRHRFHLIITACPVII
jgi:hypothetical protein